jgi:ABC-type multidrug transport system permease subunit
VGSLSFCSLAVLLASRAVNIESAKGWCDTIGVLLVIFCGVFFPSTNFPDWLQPVIRLMPMRPLLDGLRAIINEGTPLLSLSWELAVLGAWCVIPFVLAVRVFRWT